MMKQLTLGRGDGDSAGMAHVQRPPQAQADMQLLQRMLGLDKADKQDSQAQDPVFVCIDCEAFEFAQNKITEVGVATLDTRDFAGLPPGENGDGWLQKTKHAHYRPVQYAHLRNKRHVKGCESGFRFGATQWVNVGDLRQILTRIFDDPSRLHRASDFALELGSEKRNVVFVGHGVRNDKSFMERLGFSLSAQSNVVSTVDTQVLAGSTKKVQVALQRLLLALGLESTNLHNGGNDAAYTLQAMVIMAIKEHHQPGSLLSEIQAHGGKLPPIVRNNDQAPHIYAGTAREEMGGLKRNPAANDASHSPSPENVTGPDSTEMAPRGKRRKQAAVPSE